MSDDLVTWLRAQLDDDEREWSPLAIGPRQTGNPIALRILADVDAKRRILGLVTDCGPEWGDGYTEAYRDVVRLLALPYAGRPGYRDEWKP